MPRNPAPPDREAAPPAPSSPPAVTSPPGDAGRAVPATRFSPPAGAAPQSPLFPACPCCRRNPVPDARQPCAGCLAAFGDMIRPSGREVSEEQFAREVAEGDARVAAVLAERHRMTEAAA